MRNKIIFFDEEPSNVAPWELLKVAPIHCSAMRRLYSIFLGTSLLWFLIAVSWIQRLSQSSLVSTPASTTLAASAPRLEYSNTFVPPRDSFSACVMFKDDTHRLIEWLAYHYHVLRLRHVVIGVDGGSVTYPTEIVDRYNDLMKITLWPKDIFAPDSDMNVSERKKNMDAANLYIRRQTLFLRKCALHLKDQDRSWTAFIDPDEYLLFNYPGGAKPPPSAPEEIRDYVMPSMRQEGILYSFLRQEQSKDGSYSSPCITVPRLLFGSSTTPLKNGVAKLLDTLRYLSHANRRDFKSNRQAKTIMDVSRFAANQLASLKVRIVLFLCDVI